MSPQSSRQRRRSNHKSSTPQRKKKNQIKAALSTAATTDQRLNQARHLEKDGRFEEAISLFESLLVNNASDADIHEEIALLYMQVGRTQPAEHALRTAVRLNPDSGFEKYAYLSQLLGSTEEALMLARRGVAIIYAETVQLDPRLHHDRLADLREFTASANCAVAEITLAIIEDSNDPDVAASMDADVEQAVTAALAASDSGSLAEIEATLSLANLRLSQGRHQDAHTAMIRIIHNMSGALECLDDEDVNDTDASDAIDSLPSLEIRIAIGKQLIEVEMWQPAVSVLSSIMWECDFNVEVWYMLAVAHWKVGNTIEARNALDTTRSVLHNPEGYDGTLEEDMIDKLLAELGKD